MEREVIDLTEEEAKHLLNIENEFSLRGDHYTVIGRYYLGHPFWEFILHREHDNKFFSLVIHDISPKESKIISGPTENQIVEVFKKVRVTYE